MRIVRFMTDDGQICYGHPCDPQHAELLEGELFAGLRPTGRRTRVARVLAPVAPTNIFAIGRNYADHAKEGGHEPPDKPIIFMKPTSSVIGPDQAIRIPACCRPTGEVDYEGELVVIIGRGGRDIPQEQALEHVFGYTCGNEVSARVWQKHGGGGQWVRGKGFDTFCPLGPCIVTADELPNPQALRVRTSLNGQVVQDDSTAAMIFSVRYLISYLSQDTTLLPGTIIMTGTPAGVGFARTPPLWLKEGDSVAVEIEGIGRLENHVVAHSSQASSAARQP
jgi:2-keto-4-pentenoate hydratase/2-oxohepta-3-ene-1,7-dioic acid hydratase in catechol pathway